MTLRNLTVRLARLEARTPPPTCPACVNRGIQSLQQYADENLEEYWLDSDGRPECGLCPVCGQPPGGRGKVNFIHIHCSLPQILPRGCPLEQAREMTPREAALWHAGRGEDDLATLADPEWQPPPVQHQNPPIGPVPVEVKVGRTWGEGVS